MRINALVLSLVLCLASCAGSHLSNESAQLIINAWASGNGTVKVLGVHEIPSQNTAEVQLTFTGFKYKGGLNPLTGTGYDWVWNGPGTAGFIHNNDGSWVLREVVFTTPRDTYRYTPNLSSSSLPTPTPSSTSVTNADGSYEVEGTCTTGSGTSGTEYFWFEVSVRIGNEVYQGEFEPTRGQELLGRNLDRSSSIGELQNKKVHMKIDTVRPPLLVGNQTMHIGRLVSITILE